VTLIEFVLMPNRMAHAEGKTHYLFKIKRGEEVIQNVWSAPKKTIVGKLKGAWGHYCTGEKRGVQGKKDYLPHSTTTKGGNPILGGGGWGGGGGGGGWGKNSRHAIVLENSEESPAQEMRRLSRGDEWNAGAGGVCDKK